MRLRRRADAPSEDAAESSPPPVVTGVRAHGPWDASERTADDPAYVDLGALLVRGRPGLEIRLPTDNEQGTVGAVVLVTADSGVELRAFAAPKSGGLWDEVRGDLVAEVERLEGQYELMDSPLGTELRVRVGDQPSRIIGIDGPRWMLRATFLGAGASDPAKAEELEAALRDVIVVRGEAPMMAREALLLTVPEQATRLGDENA